MDIIKHGNMTHVTATESEALELIERLAIALAGLKRNPAWPAFTLAAIDHAMGDERPKPSSIAFSVTKEGK